MAAATDGGTAAAAVIITGGEGVVAITMAGTATVIGEISQPGPLDSGPFYKFDRQPSVSGPTLEFFLTFLATESFQANVSSADNRKAALPLSPGIPLPLEQNHFCRFGQLPSDARNDSRKGEFDLKFKKYEEG